MSQHIYTDAYLEHYADRYVRLCLQWDGITLLQYLASPAACERVAERWRARCAYCPPAILPQQIREAEQRLTSDIDHCPRRNGAIVEPLHHRRMPDGRRSQFCPAADHGHSHRRATS